MQSLPYYKKLADECGVELVPVCYPDEEFLIRQTLADLGVAFPVWYDEDNTFLKNNRMLKVKARYRTFLLDSSGRIVVLGEPFGRESLHKLYRARSREL